MSILGGIPYDTYLKSIAGMDWFMTQELSGSVAYATNSALALGRELVLDPGFDDPTQWDLAVIGTSWSIAAGVASYSGVDAVAAMKGLGVPFRASMTGVISFTISNAATDSADLYFGAGDASGVNQIIAKTTYVNGAHSLPVTIPATYNGAIGLVLVAYDTGDTFDIDDVSFKQTNILASSEYAPGTNPMDGAYTSVTLGGVADGNLGYAPLWDGINDNLAVISAENNSKTDPTSYHELIWVQKDTWDTTERDILSFTVDANNWIRIVDTTTAGTISWQHRAGGTTEEVTLATGSPTGGFLVGISVESGVMKAWYNEAQTGANQSVAGTFVGNFVTMNYGSRAGGFYHKGRLTRAGSSTSELPVATVSDIYYGAQI